MKKHIKDTIILINIWDHTFEPIILIRKEEMGRTLLKNEGEDHSGILRRLSFTTARRLADICPRKEMRSKKDMKVMTG